MKLTAINDKVSQMSLTAQIIEDSNFSTNDITTIKQSEITKELTFFGEINT